MADLTPEEHEFLMASDGGVAGMFGGPTALTEADAAVVALLAKVAELYPNRVQQLLLLGRISSFANGERQRLLDEILEGRFEWTLGSSVRPDDWRALAWQPYETRRLAECAGLHPTTLRARIKAATIRTLEAAKKAARDKEQVSGT